MAPILVGLVLGLTATLLSLLPADEPPSRADDVFELSVRVEGSGYVRGINEEEIWCPPDCSEAYHRVRKPESGPSEEPFITAYPDEGARFLGWSGSACSAESETSCMFLMDKDRTLVARFTQTRQSPSLTVKKTGAGVGAVVSYRIAFDDPDATIVPGNYPVLEDTGGIDCGYRCSAAYVSGAERVLIAYPGARSSFVRWTGDVECMARDRPFCFVRIEGAERVTAIFESAD
jgi:hypothetical protein